MGNLSRYFSLRRQRGLVTLADWSLHASNVFVRFLYPYRVFQQEDVCLALLLLCTCHQIPKQRVLVISDDLDQPLAAVRLRGKGGHGGHNGLRSIIHHLGGSQEFARIKIGKPEFFSLDRGR